MRKDLKRIFWFLPVLALVILAVTAGAQAPPRRIDVLQVRGPIVPVVADYILRGLEESQKGAQAIVIELDTPGGLVNVTQRIIQAFLASPVPVVVYVSPAGAWAGSAGAFITQAGHIAAMAPGTIIGAAHPVTVGGQLPSAQEEKVVNALASTIRSIAEERHRNVQAAEDMVRKSLAKGDQEALELGIIDYRAESLRELLEKLEGREVTVSGGRTVTLRTRGAPLRRIPMTTVESFLHTISEPNIAYILLALAMLAIAVELSNPGAIFPGVIGGIALFLALYSLGILGANWAGVLLIALAFAMLVAEVFVTSHGVLAVGGIAALIMGSFLLFSGTAFAINRWLVAGMAAGLLAFFVFALTSVVQTHRRPQQTGREAMVGMVAAVRTPLKPRGTVVVHGELWEAVSQEGPVEEGEEVVVQRLEGLRLFVTRKK